MIDREQLEQTREEMRQRIEAAQDRFSQWQAKFAQIQNETAREIIEAEGVIKWITETLGDDDESDVRGDVHG